MDELLLRSARVKHVHPNRGLRVGAILHTITPLRDKHVIAIVLILLTSLVTQLSSERLGEVIFRLASQREGNYQVVHRKKRYQQEEQIQ